MNLLVDENISPGIANWLRDEGHDVLVVRELARGCADPLVLSLAATARRTLLTRDKDFGELVFRKGLSAAGVVLLRIRTTSKAEFARVLRAAWPRIEARAEGNFVVVTNRAVRTHPLPQRQP